MEMTSCPRCGSTDVTTSRASRPYTQAGLHRVVLADIETRVCASCGSEAVVIPDIAGLHRTIARALVLKLGRLAGEEIRFLRKYLGLSSGTFADLVGTEDDVVLAWEGSTKKLPMRTDVALRALIVARQPVTAYPAEKIAKAAARRSSDPVHIRVSKKRNDWRATPSMHA